MIEPGNHNECIYGNNWLHYKFYSNNWNVCHHIYGLKFFEDIFFYILKNRIIKKNHQNTPLFPLISRNACNGHNSKNREKSPASDNLSWMPNVAPWRLAILAILAKLAILGKIARGLAKMAKNVLAPRRLPILAKYSSFLSMLTGGQYGFESWCTVAIVNVNANVNVAIERTNIHVLFT